jgi:hypothetical protein
MTEGDKMRLRREGLFFMDITEHEEYYAQHAADAAVAGKARELRHPAQVRRGLTQGRSA